MQQFLQRVFLGLAVASMFGCSDIRLPSLDGMLEGQDGGSIHVKESNKSNPNAPLKNAASIHINRYTDARKMASPRKIGTGAEHVFGMSGTDIVLDQDADLMVTDAMKTRLDEAGFRVSEAQTGNALFELSGVIKELNFDVKARDEVSIAIETTLKEIDTGKVLWAGIVVEKNDRFAGVSGNNKNDVAMYLRKELGIVTGKTTEALSFSLMAARPDLFNLTSGAKAIPGVTVLTAQAPISPGQQLAPMPAGDTVSPSQAYVPHATSTHGLLLVNTSPTRAKVYLNDVYYGLSPLRLEMEPGVHTIRVSLDGYKMVVEKTSVRKGDTTEMELSLER